MEEKIALLFITQNIAPFRMMWLSELAKDMQINVFHLNDYHETVNKKYLEYNSDNISVSDKSVKILKWKFFKISSILRQPHDVLLLDGYGFIGQVFLIAILRLLNKKYLMTLDGGFIPEHENFFKRKIKKFCMDGVDAFFSTSKFTDEYIQHYVGTKKTIYRHYFSSVLSRDICSVEERLTLHDKYREKTGFGNKIIVIAVGRFIPIKGFDILLKAAKHVQTDVGFVFVGGKPGEDYLELIDDSNREKITFIDFLSAEELKKYYYAADLFVMPSRGDVWGLVVAEAMACGLPVIASAKCLAAKAMISQGENGYIIEDNENVESYVDFIHKLAQDKALREKMTSNNLAKVSKYAVDEASKKDIKHIRDYMINNCKGRRC